MPRNVRDIVRFEHLQAELDVREQDIGRAARDDIQGLAVLLPAVDLAAGEFAPETVGFDDGAAAKILGKRPDSDLVRPPLPDEHLAAFIGMCGPCCGQIDGTRRNA
jgi:hypothetical protein